MCGRYQLANELCQIIDRYNIDIKDTNIIFKPKYEIFPSDEVPVVVFEGSKKRLKIMKWGFRLSYAKKLIINARSETVHMKQTFRNSFINKRCIVPANGFFEWEKKDGKSIKYIISLKDEEIFSIAGIYNTFIDKRGSCYEAYTILTTYSSSPLKSIHHRMPVIIDREKEELWLNDSCKDINVLKRLLVPTSKKIIINNG